MKTLEVAMLVVVGLTGVDARAAGFGVPAMGIPYRGHLEHDGVPLDRDVSMTIQLWDDPTASDTNVNLLYTWSGTVPVGAGEFSVLLGAEPDNPLPEKVLAAAKLFVSVTVDGTPLDGRQQLFPSLQSVMAGQGANAFTVRDPTVPGAYMSLDPKYGITGQNPYGSMILQPAGGGALYFNYGGGSGVNFCNGAGVCPTSIDGAGAISLGQNTIQKNNEVLHIDPATNGKVYLNWFRGLKVIFGGGNSASNAGQEVASVDSDGNIYAKGQVKMGHTIVTCQVNDWPNYYCNGTPDKHYCCDCPTGYKLLGGGGSCRPGSWLVSNRPVDEDTWGVYCTTNNEQANFLFPYNVYAICARIAP